jgi:hypothetical protein
MKHRFFYAFEWQSVVNDVIRQTKNVVLIASRCDEETSSIQKKLTNDDFFKFDREVPKVPEFKHKPEGVDWSEWSNEQSSNRKVILEIKKEQLKQRVVFIPDLYWKENFEAVIYASRKPKDKNWSEWIEASGDICAEWYEQLELCGSLPIVCLVLMDHGNRTNNLHRILTETNLIVVSSTERGVRVPTGKVVDGKSQTILETNTKFLYGRPPLPDFNNLTDDEHDRYLADGVRGLDDLIPVYDFDVQSFSFETNLGRHHHQTSRTSGVNRQNRDVVK